MYGIPAVFGMQVELTEFSLVARPSTGACPSRKCSSAHVAAFSPNASTSSSSAQTRTSSTCFPSLFSLQLTQPPPPCV